MSEFHPTSKGPRQENLDYFCGAPGKEDQRQWFVERGLTPTNNLGLYFITEPGTELLPGLPHPNDYTQRPFGEILDAYRTQNPEIAQAIRDIGLARSTEMKQLWEALQAGDRDRAASIEAASEITRYEHAQLTHEAFHTMLPDLEAAGIDPLDVCR